MARKNYRRRMRRGYKRRSRKKYALRKNAALARFNRLSYNVKLKSPIIAATTDFNGFLDYAFELRDINAISSVNGGSTFAGAVLELSQWAALFDEYRVNGFKVQYHPDFYGQSPITLNSTDQETLILSQAPMVTCFDIDSHTSSATSYDDLFQYDNAKMRMPTRPFKQYIPLRGRDEKTRWWDLAFSGSPGQLTYPKPGAFRVFIQGANTQTQYGRFKLTYYVSLRGRH